MCLARDRWRTPYEQLNPISFAALVVHTNAMLAVIGTLGIVVYDRVGLAFLRRGWINLDVLWGAALVAGGMVLLAR